LLTLALGVTFIADAVPMLADQQKPATPLFRSGIDLVMVDVIVRDKSGNVVRNLKPEDFEIFEDGKPQSISSFDFEEVTTASKPMEASTILEVGKVNLAPVKPAAPPTSAPAPAAAEPPKDPVTKEDLAGRRLVILLFDTSSMQPEDVQRAIDSAVKYVETQMTDADLVAVATVSTTLNILSDFTPDRVKVHNVLAGLSSVSGMATTEAVASTTATDEAAAAATEDTTAESSEFDLFNNDVRLKAIRTLSERLQDIEQKKAIVYFSAGMQRSGNDNQVELRLAVNSAVRANVSIYPVDTRGLQAIVPGGAASQGSRGGRGAFSGSGVRQQITQLASSQETLTTLAADTGGTAFTDSNDFSGAFTKVQRDISAYYILGYSSTNPALDGRYRRIQVKLKRSEFKVEFRAGYYADRDFTHTSRADRQFAMQEQLMSQVSPTDLPVVMSANYFRIAADRYFVPLSLAIPGSAIPTSKDKITLDVLGYVRDERGFPVGQIRDTVTIPPASTATLANKQVQYQSAVTLPPGRFTMKVVVRENASGQTGSYETPITVPELNRAPVKVSSVVLSTQVQAATKARPDNPLVRGGTEIVPSLTHVVQQGQHLYFYYEVYDPATEGGLPKLQTSLAFYRGKVKVMETPLVERTAIDVPARKAALFQFDVPAAGFKPGLYTCQVNVIDEAGGKFAFPRLAFYVR
ncbi:MAG: VWA domain-containing protein, partial [Acidobacteria bacterium]